jgi:hypothetical protein
MHLVLIHCMLLFFVFSQNPKDEVILREVLYDVVITMSYSFSIPQKGIEPPGVQLKNLSLTWLFVADNAIRFVRYETINSSCEAIVY